MPAVPLTGRLGLRPARTGRAGRQCFRRR